MVRFRLNFGPQTTVTPTRARGAPNFEISEGAGRGLQLLGLQKLHDFSVAEPAQALGLELRGGGGGVGGDGGFGGFGGLGGVGGVGGFGVG